MFFVGAIFLFLLDSWLMVRKVSYLHNKQASHGEEVIASMVAIFVILVLLILLIIYINNPILRAVAIASGIMIGIFTVSTS
jgi:hypothetical protein